VSVEELKRAIDPGAGLLLVVPDGTFGGARRMVNKYPPGCPRGLAAGRPASPISLSCSVSVARVRPGRKAEFVSVPGTEVRRQRGRHWKVTRPAPSRPNQWRRVSTLEAVAAFMREVGEDPAVSSALISNMKIQMDRALKQKQKPTIYGT